MIKQLIIVIFCINLFFIANPGMCQEQENTLKNEQITITCQDLGSDLDISESEILQLEREALNGSGEAALRLCLYYEIRKEDLEETMYWECIAAENGHVVSQYNYAIHLLNENYIKAYYTDPKMINRAKIRARFWLKKAAEQGHKYAKDKQGNFNNETIAKNLKIPLSDVLNAWTYWENEGIVLRRDIEDEYDYRVEFVNLKQLYIDNVYI